MTYNEAVVSIFPHALYKHFKGDVYEVLGIAKHSETLEPIVLYQNISYRGILWARPASMWFDEVAPGVKRFERKVINS